MTKPQTGELYNREKGTLITTGSPRKRKEARRLIAHQRYVVWHHNYGQCLFVYLEHNTKYFINAREVPPYFIPVRKEPPGLGVTGTAGGGTAIFHYCEKFTAIIHYCEKITTIFLSRRYERYLAGIPMMALLEVWAWESRLHKVPEGGLLRRGEVTPYLFHGEVPFLRPFSIMMSSSTLF